MKKLIFSLTILVLVVAFGLYCINYYYKSSNELSQMIEKVTDSVNSEDWQSAKNQVDIIQEVWDKTEKKWTLLIDHFEIDNIAMSLTKAKKYIETKDLTLSLAEIENLKFLVDHIYEKESFNLENIF